MLLDNLPHTATAKVRTRALDSLGGPKDTFAIVFSDRACWQQPASSREIMQAKQRDIAITDKVYFAADPELDERHVLVIDGITYSVRDVAHPDASSGLGVLYRVMVLQEDYAA
jgi:hypothetical protein